MLHHYVHSLVLICWSLASISSGASAAKLHLLTSFSLLGCLQGQAFTLVISLFWCFNSQAFTCMGTHKLSSAVWAAHLALSLALRLLNQTSLCSAVSERWWALSPSHLLWSCLSVSHCHVPLLQWLWKIHNDDLCLLFLELTHAL